MSFFAKKDQKILGLFGQWCFDSTRQMSGVFLVLFVHKKNFFAPALPGFVESVLRLFAGGEFVAGEGDEMVDGGGE